MASLDLDVARATGSGIGEGSEPYLAVTGEAWMRFYFCASVLKKGYKNRPPGRKMYPLGRKMNPQAASSGRCLLRIEHNAARARGDVSGKVT